MVLKGILLGALAAGLNGVLACACLRWAFNKSNRVFYGVFFGGMLWKLLTLFAGFFFLLKHPVADVPSALMSMAAGTLLLNIVELGFLPKHA